MFCCCFVFKIRSAWFYHCLHFSYLIKFCFLRRTNDEEDTRGWRSRKDCKDSWDATAIFSVLPSSSQLVGEHVSSPGTRSKEACVCQWIHPQRVGHPSFKDSKGVLKVVLSVPLWMPAPSHHSLTIAIPLSSPERCQPVHVCVCPCALQPGWLMMALLKDREIEDCVKNSELELWSSICLAHKRPRSSISSTAKIITVKQYKVDTDNSTVHIQ